MHQKTDEEELKCRYCLSSSLHLDWAAGDRICTNCGIVDEEHVRDDRQEWREYNEDNDLAKNAPSQARCGLIPTDETKYVGGLQPTSLSRHPFGGALHGSASARMTLCKTHKKIESMLERKHVEEIRQRELERKVRVQRREERKRRIVMSGDDDDGMVVSNLKEEEEEEEEEEDETATSPKALHADKWSLERALILNGTHDEAQSILDSSPHLPTSLETERNQLLERLTPSHRLAARDVYDAYRTLSSASQKLALPSRVVREACHLMCRYLMTKNGFHVKGVRIKEEKEGETTTTTTAGKDEKESVRERNKTKQIAALTGAILYLSAKQSGWGRTLAEVCSSIHPSNSTNIQQQQHPINLKPKTVSKAITELKTTFPELIRSITSPSVEAANLVQHAAKSLNLPSVAIGAIRTLTLHCGSEERSIETGIGAGVKPSVICGAVTYLVCLAGAVMQRLAKQALLEKERCRRMEEGGGKKKCRRMEEVERKTNLEAKMIVMPMEVKRRKKEEMKKRKGCFDGEEQIRAMTNGTKKPALVKSSSAANGNDDDDQRNKTITKQNPTEQCHTQESTSQNPHTPPLTKPQPLLDPISILSTTSSQQQQQQQQQFDALSSKPLPQTSNRELETLQGWFSWSNQRKWNRELDDIAKSVHSSKTAILECYKKYLHNRRYALLQVVQEFLKRSEDGDVCYLVNIGNAAPLMILGQT